MDRSLREELALRIMSSKQNHQHKCRDLETQYANSTETIDKAMLRRAIALHEADKITQQILDIKGRYTIETLERDVYRRKNETREGLKQTEQAIEHLKRDHALEYKSMAETMTEYELKILGATQAAEFEAFVRHSSTLLEKMTQEWQQQERVLKIINIVLSGRNDDDITIPPELRHVHAEMIEYNNELSGLVDIIKFETNIIAKLEARINELQHEHDNVQIANHIEQTEFANKKKKFERLSAQATSCSAANNAHHAKLKHSMITVKEQLLATEANVDDISLQLSAHMKHVSECGKTVATQIEALQALVHHIRDDDLNKKITLERVVAEIDHMRSVNTTQAAEGARLTHVNADLAHKISSTEAACAERVRHQKHTTMLINDDKDVSREVLQECNNIAKECLDGFAATNAKLYKCKENVHELKEQIKTLNAANMDIQKMITLRSD